ncbi:MAG TPA: cupin domain-containing protein [Polyangiaceae bacterium]|nr:cupin domain-containing protein [Polyangiaceae bacterium]
MTRKQDHQPGAAFHAERRPVYDGPLGWAVNKQGARMARVHYEAPHENPAERGARRGGGNEYATWLLSEEGAQAERIFTAPLELMIDATFEPGAGVGLHVHRDTEEVYYVLEGSMTMTTVGPGGEEHEARLGAGDVHVVKLGQGHFGVAGPEGARVIVVGVRAR